MWCNFEGKLKLFFFIPNVGHYLELDIIYIQIIFQLQIEDQSFSAHRIVLASTIPYFYAMFTHNLVESRIKEIEMKEIEPQ